MQLCRATRLARDDQFAVDERQVRIRDNASSRSRIAVIPA
jgi:hypothetical protein